MADAVNGTGMKNFKKPEIFITETKIFYLFILGTTFFSMLILFAVGISALIIKLYLLLFFLGLSISYFSKKIKIYLISTWGFTTFSMIFIHSVSAYLAIKASWELNVTYGYIAIGVYLLYMGLFIVYDIPQIKIAIKQQKIITRIKLLKYTKSQDKYLYITEDKFMTSGDKDFPDDIKATNFMTIKIMLIVAVPLVIIGGAGPALGLYVARYFPSSQEFMLGILMMPLFGMLGTLTLGGFIGFLQTNFDEIAQEVADKNGI